MEKVLYEEFINNILATRGRFSCGDEYHERHHILPKCCGGNNRKENLIDLFPKEHFIAHKMLRDENPGNEKLNFAFYAMAFMKNGSEQRYELTPEEYEEARITQSSFMRELYKDKSRHPSYGKHLSEERKKYIGLVNKGNKYCVGRVVSEETRRKISIANSNKSEEARRKMSLSRKGKQLLGENPNAKCVVRLSDGKVYQCAKSAAIENGVNYSTFKASVRRGNGFKYLSEMQNISEN